MEGGSCYDTEGYGETEHHYYGGVEKNGIRRGCATCLNAHNSRMWTNRIRWPWKAVEVGDDEDDDSNSEDDIQGVFGNGGCRHTRCTTCITKLYNRRGGWTTSNNPDKLYPWLLEGTLDEEEEVDGVVTATATTTTPAAPDVWMQTQVLQNQIMSLQAQVEDNQRLDEQLRLQLQM